MALRVLLADESSTIKKAIQMVLSDYGVEVKTVPTGIDVLSVTLSFKPDIILADILLNKKNGYEVSQELKNNPETRSVPIILMWSSFMQIDQQQLQNCGAEASLEKPFDTDNIRNLVEKLVPKLQTFPLKGFLNHGSMPDFEESDTFVRQKGDFTMQQIKRQQEEMERQESAEAMPPGGIPVLDEAEDGLIEIPTSPSEADPADPFAIHTLEPVREKSVVKQVPVEKAAPVAAPPKQAKKEVTKVTEINEEDEPDQFTKTNLNKNAKREDGEWSGGKANQFIIETESFGDFEEVKVISSRNEDTPDLQKRISEQIQNYIKDSPVATHKAQNAYQQKNNYSSFDEQLMREEIRQITERICWQVIPEVAEKIIREELSKLMQGIENSV